MVKKFNQFILESKNELRGDSFPKDMGEFTNLISSILNKIGITHRVDAIHENIIHFHIEGENTGHDGTWYSGDDILLFRLLGSGDPTVENIVTRLKDLNGEWIWGAYDYCRNVEQFISYLTEAFHINMGNVMKKINN
tara:strand:- start:81853 stop:82263 length:411 start_codon:yes stop_codon:yes gene_type:complete